MVGARTRRASAVLAAAAALAVLAGCGDDDGDEAGGLFGDQAGQDEVDAEADDAGSGGDDEDGSGDGGDDEDAGGVGDDADEDAACDAVAEIGEYDDESSALSTAVASATDPEDAEARQQELIAFIVDNGDDVLGAYDDLVAATPRDVAEDVGIVRDLTAQAIELLRETEDVEDIVAVFDELEDEAIAAGEATLRIDGYVQETCGFGFAG